MSKLYDRVKSALEQDNTITIPKNLLHTAKGFTEEYMGYLGLKKTDLKKLESKGLALRGYTKIKGADHVRWILVAKEQEVSNDSDSTVQAVPTSQDQNKDG